MRRRTGNSMNVIGRAITRAFAVVSSSIDLSALVSGKAAASLLFLLAAPLLFPQDTVTASPKNLTTWNIKTAKQVEATLDKSDAVLDWNDTALAAIQTLELPPPIATYCLAMAHAAIFDAVNSIIGDYQPYVAPVSAPPGARAAAAAAQAGHDVLVAVMPLSVKSQLDSALQASLAKLPNDQHTQDGVTVGRSVASRLLALRSGDAPFLNPIYPFTQPPVGPGVWGPDYPPFFGVFAGVGQMQPFTMTSPSQFRPGPPPALTSDAFTQDFLEVKAFGSNSSTARTQDDHHGHIIAVL